MRISSIVFLVLAAALGREAGAAETIQASSIFDKPSLGGKQLRILPAAAPVQVTGQIVNQDGIKWVPVSTADGAAGWAVRESLRLGEKDPGYQNWKGKGNSPLVWASFGPSVMNSTDSFTALRFAFGADWFVNQNYRFFIGPMVTTEFSKEELSSEFGGKSQRYNTYFSFGYLLLPDRLYCRFGLGLSPLAGANRNLAHKFGLAGSAELGYQFALSDRTKLGLSFGFEYTGKARQSVNFVQDLQHCLFGGCDASHSVPSASIYSLNATFSFAP